MLILFLSIVLITYLSIKEFYPVLGLSPLILYVSYTSLSERIYWKLKINSWKSPYS